MKVHFSDNQIIELLGGTKRVSKLCNVAPPAVTQWRSRGIPHGQLLFLAALLEKESHGLVTRKDLFPKNWWFVWPELANKKNIV
jgi:DNA-binding transcriptional regulator YdaS (Cro superfamily)